MIVPEPVARPLSPYDARLAPWRAFLEAHTRVSRRLDEELRAEHDLSLAEYDTLLTIAWAPDRRIRMRTLADSILLSKSGVTRLIDRLVADGLVERSACLSDARGAEAVLTPSGLERLRAAATTHMRGIDNHFHHHAVEFLCGALRPVIDGKVKPDQLKALLEIEMDAAEEEHHAPVSVLTKTSDAMPGFGIVAAVLGIVVTMASIGGPVSEIGHHVAAALVGTFLGILVSYGYLSPLVVNIELTGAAHMAYTRCLASAVVGFANGMAPMMAVEVARRGLSSDVKPTAEALEEMLKAIGKK